MMVIRVYSTGLITTNFLLCGILILKYICLSIQLRIPGVRGMNPETGGWVPRGEGAARSVCVGGGGCPTLGTTSTTCNKLRWFQPYV